MMIDEEKPKKRKMIPIKVIKAKSDSALVEFIADGLLLRAYIPTVEIEADKVAEAVLLAGVPYGVDWEEVKLKASPIELANALRRHGIWTHEDAQCNPNVIISCLQSVYGVDLAALLKYAREQN